MKQKNLHFSLCMKYEDALKAVRKCLVQSGFGIEERHDSMAITGLETVDEPGKCHELAIYEVEQSDVEAMIIGSRDLLPRVVVCASHGGFAEVFLSQSRDESESSVWDSPLRMTDATALRLARVMLDAGKSAFLPREIDPNGSDSSDLLGHRT